MTATVSGELLLFYDYRATQAVWSSLDRFKAFDSCKTVKAHYNVALIGGSRSGELTAAPVGDKNLKPQL
jgi:hypothetical protein